MIRIILKFLMDLGFAGVVASWILHFFYSEHYNDTVFMYMLSTSAALTMPYLIWQLVTIHKLRKEIAVLNRQEPAPLKSLVTCRRESIAKIEAALDTFGMYICDDAKNVPEWKLFWDCYEALDPVFDKVKKDFCEEKGHEVAPDHCGRMEHDYCITCGTSATELYGKDYTRKCPERKV